MAFLTGSDLAFYRGHGLPAGWASIGYTKADLPQLNNSGKYPSVFSLTCSAGSFGVAQASASFSEEIQTMEEKGAVWTIGASRVTLTPHNDIFCRGILDYFFDTYVPAFSAAGFDRFMRPSEAANYGKVYLRSIYNTSATTMTWRAFNVFW